MSGGRKALRTYSMNTQHCLESKINNFCGNMDNIFGRVRHMFIFYLQIWSFQNTRG